MGNTRCRLLVLSCSLLCLLLPLNAASEPFKLHEIYGPEFRLSSKEHQEAYEAAQNLAHKDDFKAGLAVLLKALASVEHAAVVPPRDVLLLLLAKAQILSSQYDLREADRVVARCEEIIARLPGEQALAAETLSQRGNLLQGLAKFSQAAASFQSSLELFEASYGADGVAVADALCSLAAAVAMQRDYEKALPLLRRAHSIYEKKLGPRTVRSALALRAMADILCEHSRFEDALNLAKQAIEICEESLGAEHSSVALCCFSLALIYQDSGDWAQCLQTILRVAAIVERVRGPNHPDLAMCFDKLAETYEEIGDYQKALSFALRSLTIKEKTLGAEHPLLATSWQSLGEFHERRGSYTNAVTFFTLALGNRILAYGKEHPYVANSLDVLGQLYLKRGDHPSALHYFTNGLSIREKALGPEHPEVAVSLANIGLVRHLLEEDDDCVRLLERAIQIVESSKGPTNPDLLQLRQNLALACIAAGDFEKALLTLATASRNQTEYLATQLLALPSSSAVQTDVLTYVDRAIFHSMCSTREGANQEHAWTIAAEQSSLTKALLEELQACKASLEADPRTSTRQLRQDHFALVAQSEQLAETDSPHSDADWRRRELEKDLKQLQSKLAEQLTAVAQQFRERDLKLADIASTLPANSALIDLVHHRRFDVAAKTNQWKEQIYVGYVTFPAREHSTNVLVKRIDLGEAAPINAGVEQFCKLMGAGQIAEKRLQPALQRLSELVYAPLAKHLTNVEHLIVCPDGQLSRVPFEMLLHDSKYLVEQKTISYVGSGREVARLAQKRSEAEARRLGPSLVMGDPDFDLDLASARAARAVADHSSVTQQPDSSSRREEALAQKSEIRNQKSEIEQNLLTSAATERIRSLSRSFTGRKFTRLPAAAEEARSVAKLLGGDVALRLGAEAREAELKAVVSPRVLHLATHGFFLSDQEFKHTNALPELWASSQRPFRRSEFDWENPLIRCGIALAGANRFSELGDRRLEIGVEDGLLTGLEASLLNLEGTELVILSACESGTGEIKIGEGVMSLRRAFRIAGAETVLASHWPVSDKATSLLMTEFMRRWRSGEPRAKAWREAQLSLLRSSDYSSPYFWAAFTLTGQWR